MDPKDLNNGGMQAKGAKKSGNAPGKVANTDDYGQGGSSGRAEPGKRSGTEHLPDGPNGEGEGKAKLNASKFGGGPGIQGPVEPPKAKKTDVPAKAAKKAAAAAKPVDGAKVAPKAKAGGEAKVNAQPAAHINHEPALAFQPRSAEPAKITDVPDVAPPAAVVLAPPAKGKIDPTFETLRSEVATLSGLIKSSHDEILAVSKQLQQTVASQLDEYAASIDQKVEAGTKRVGSAYDVVGKAITDAGTHANEEIAKREQAIPATIKTARDKKAGEIKNVVNTTKLDAHNKLTAGPQAAAAKQTAIKFADSIKTKHAELKARIKADTSPGGAVAGQLNPKKYSAQVQVGGESARAVGLQALAEDKRLSLITKAADQALKFIDNVLTPKEDAYRKQSGIIITESLGAADKDLDKAVAQHEPELQKNLDDAAATATKTLQKQVETQRAGIANTQKTATTRLAQDRKSAEDGAHKAGKQLAADIKSGSKEIQNKLAKKAAQDATSYGKLTQLLHQIGASKKLDAPTRAKLDSLKAQLDTAHAENRKTLEELATSAVAQLKSGKEQQYEHAIQGYENNATKTKNELVGTMTTATSSLGKSFDTIGTSFDATVASQTKKLGVELQFYANEAPKVPEMYGTTLDKQLTSVIEGLGKGADSMLEPLKLQEKLDKDSEPAIKAAMKTGPEDAQGLWDAMDGVGTDENKIFGILRKATPGEIIFIEGCYNDAYSKRGTSKYPSPLRADLDDELSGSEWDIAFSYLRHEREKALKLELDNSTHWYNDEEDRIEEVLRAASDEEMQNIMHSPDGKAAVDGVKKHLGDCDLDVVNALTNTDIPIAERKIQADAIRVYDAMYGGITGAGTDEAKIKEKLAACKTKEERQALHDAYNAYIRQKDPLKVAELERQSGKGADLMDASFDDEMSGGEWTTVRTMSETKLSDEEHDKTLKMAKLVEGAQGGGTDEDMMVDALEDEKYAEEYAKEKDPVKRAAMAKAHEAELDKRLQYITDNGMMTKSFKKDGSENGVADIIKGEMGSSSITFEELIERRWSIDKEKRGDKAGKPIEDVASLQSAARAGILNLEQMVAQRTLQAGKAEPELLIAYACWGVSGTDETTLKKALKKNGELRTKNEVFKLREAFFKAWGIDMMEGSNELDRKDFKEPSGVVPSEVDGKDGLEVRVALMGKPENPAEIAYVDNVRYRFVTSGNGSPSPWSHAREDMEVNHKNLQAKAAEHINDKDLKAYDAQKPPELTDEQKQANARKTTKDPISSAAYLEDNRLETLAGYAEKSEMAFLEAKEAMANAVITVIEIIGAALITAASMGASSPMLVMFIGNLILSGMTIMMRKDMVGDAYGAEDIGIDVVKGIVMAGIQAAGEAKVVADFAGKAGKMAGKAWEIFAGGAEKGGMRVVEGQALAIAEKAAVKLEGQVAKAAGSTAAKTATKETEKVAVATAAKEVESVAGKGVVTTAEKVGAKEAAGVGTKEAATAAEKLGAKEAVQATEKAAAGQAAKKSAAEQVEQYATAGFKNATTTAMSETAQFVMDEKTYEMKFWDALFDNPNSLGRRLLNSVPSAFAQGAVQDYISNIAGAASPKAVGKIRSGSEAMFRQILAEFGGNAAGFLVHIDNYQDAGTFWIEFLKSSARSVASGGFNGIFGHAMRAKSLARELVNAHQEGGDLHDIMGRLHEAAGYMQPDEMSNLANHVASMNPNSVDLLPDGFKKYVNKQSTAGAQVTQPGGDTTPITQKNPGEEQQAAKQKEEQKPAANDNEKPVVDEHKEPVLPATEEEKKAAKPVTTADEDKKVAAKPHDEEKAAGKPEEKPAVDEKSASDKDAPVKKEGVATGSTLESGADGRSTTKNLEHETTNLPALKERATVALEKLKAGDQHQVRETLAKAENEGQVAMLERALAAGRKPEELETLRGAMKGLSADEVAKRFTGAGVVQFYHQSCVPTAYQIAIADVDPFYAFQLRNHPELVMAEQRKVLQDAGAAQTKRKDLETGSKNITDHASEEGGMKNVLNDPKSYSDKGNKDGIDSAKMAGTDIHKQLEHATGHPYEILVNQKFTEYRGPASYEDGSTPHARIIAALDQKLPVIVGKMNLDGTGHAIVIIGYEKLPNGQIKYIARDPMNGHIETKTPDQFEGFGNFTSITIPAAAKSAGGTEHPTTAKTGGSGSDKDSPKTWHDEGKQLEKPDPESFSEAHERRSQGVKPKNPEHADEFATPTNRKNVPETVPLSRQELRDILVAKYGSFLEPYLNAKHSQASEYDQLLVELANEKPGGAKEDPAKAEAYEARINKAGEDLAKRTGQSDAELRSFYNLVEKEQMRTVWFPALKDVPLEQQAKLMSMYREELKIFVRDMMRDDNAKEVLYLRDRFVYGDRRGPRFDDIYAKNLKKTGSDEGASKAIIDSSMRSNEGFNLKTTGYKDGIEPSVGDKIRSSAKNPEEELPAIKAKNQEIIDSEKGTTVKTGGDDKMSTTAKDEQEAHAGRNAEIHINNDAPLKPLAGEAKDLRGELDALWKLREKLADKKTPPDQIDAIKAQIKAAQQELDKKIANPVYKDDLLDPHVAFALAREANVTDKKSTPEELLRSAAVQKFLGDNLEAFRKAQDQARQGADPQLRAKREIFEREVAKTVLQDGATKQKVDANLDAMSKKVLDYIKSSRAGDVDGYHEALAFLGAQASDGYAGAVLTAKGDPKIPGSVKAANEANAQVMLAVLQSGNVRERMIALGKFSELVATDMIKKPAAFDKAAGAEGSAFTQKEADAYRARMEQQKKDMKFTGSDDQIGDSKQAQDYQKAMIGSFLKPNSEEKKGSQSDFQAAKKQEMDTKIMSVAETTAKGFPSTGSETGAGEKSKLARTSITLEEAQRLGYELSPREIEIAKANGGKLPWVVGTVANVVDPSADFIAKGAEASLPQKAGISGTTFRFMEAAQLLGGDAMASRLAMIGALQVIDAHTIYEIANASKDFGAGGKGGELAFDISRPYDNIGIPRDQLEQIALRTGTSFAELNGETKANPPSGNSE
ncbi:MAG: hypothetical protein HOV81_01735 [Kofleriaceae bacterium]|nr:hypothetical protein [Kofleriaceae bacterium]